MGLFNSKQKKSVKKKASKKSSRAEGSSKIPKLEEDSEESLPKLPSFPDNDLGKKLSQDSIKEAVSGEKEEDVLAQEIGEPEVPRHSENFPSQNLESFKKDSPSRRTSRSKKDPLFVRLDKFQESLEIFETTKEKVSEMQKALNEIKEIKSKEEKELSDWEQKIQEVKKQIDKVDEDLFSRIDE